MEGRPAAHPSQAQGIMHLPFLCLFSLSLGTRTSKNSDESTGLLARVLANSFAPLLHSAPLARVFVRSVAPLFHLLAHSLTHSLSSLWGSG